MGESPEEGRELGASSSAIEHLSSLCASLGSTQHQKIEEMEGKRKERESPGRGQSLESDCPVSLPRDP